MFLEVKLNEVLCWKLMDVDVRLVSSVADMLVVDDKPSKRAKLILVIIELACDIEFSD